MLKALGIKKDVPEDKRKKYKELTHDCDKWQEDNEALRTALDELQTAYVAHKADCAVGRYEALKVMIKEARSRYRAVTEKPETEVDGSSGIIQGGLLQGLKAFRDHTTRIANEEITIARMSNKEMAAELDRLKELLDKAMRQGSTHKETFDKLNTDYESSKRQLPPQRYYTMKDMVKVAVRTTTCNV